jgi:2,3-bisphosphoglycerate-dependent phosphoglycerate mutase
MTFTLILLRHGNSDWNTKNLFTGWVDVDLSDQGRAEARRAGELIAESGVLPDIQYTSVLKRAIHTANIALDVADRDWIDVKRSWRLNERRQVMNCSWPYSSRVCALSLPWSAP